MKKLGICIALASVASLLLLIACQEKGNVKYFRHLRMYKIHDLDFAYPVDPKDYKKINCWRVEYDENGRIVKALFLKNGKPAMDNYNELSSIVIRYSDDSEKWYTQDSNGLPADKNIAYKTFHFDSTGILLSLTNYSTSGDIAENNSGVATYLYTSDIDNDILTSIHLNINSDSVVNNNGHYKLVFKYDDSKNLIKMANYDRETKLLQDKDGVAVYGYKNNEFGNRTEVSFYDNSGNKTVALGTGASRVTYNYDINGNNTDIKFFDENDRLVINKKHKFAHGITKFNERGDLIELARYGEKDNPLFITKLFQSGAVKEEIIYSTFHRLKGFEDEEYDYYIVKANEEGNPYEYSFYNADGTLHEVKKGFSIIEYCWNKKGNLKEIQFFDADSELIVKSTK